MTQDSDIKIKANPDLRLIRVLKECVIQENKKYCLERLNIMSFNELRIIIDEYLQQNKTIYIDDFFNFFYSKINFKDKISKLLTCKDPRLMLTIKNRLKNAIRKIEVNDYYEKELHVKKGNISLYLSNRYFNYIFNNKLYINNLTFINSASIDNYLINISKIYFPILFPNLSEFLVDDDEDYWSKIYLIFRFCYTSHLNHWVDDKSLRIDIQEDKISESYYALHDNIVNKKTRFESAYHFMNYMRKICRLKTLEFLRKQKSFRRKLETLKSDNVFVAEESPQDEIFDVTIDINNFEIDRGKMQTAMILLLLDSSHPLYRVLVENKNDLVETFVAIHTKDIDYKEVIETKFGTNISNERFKNEYENLRQKMCRLKKALIERFEKLVKTNSDFRNYYKSI